MYQRLAIDFERKEQQAVLSERKNALRKLREFKRVVGGAEINEHNLMYERLKEQRKEEIRQKRKAELAEIRERSAIVN